MNIKNNLITIIVGGRVTYNVTNYHDGEIIAIAKKMGSRHLEELQNIAKELGIETINNNELEMMKILATHGHSVILNYGLQDNKQSGLIILPAQLTMLQIQSFELIKEELIEEYSSITSCAIPSKPLSYKGDLKLMEYEDKINGINLKDVESLYNEINNHKQNFLIKEEFDGRNNK